MIPFSPKYYLPLIAFLLVFASCQKPKIPTFSKMDKIVIASITQKEIIIKGNAIIDNPGDQLYEITSGKYNVSIEGLSVGEINHDLEAFILPNQTTSVPLKIKIASKDLPKTGWLTKLFGIIASQQATVSLKGYFMLKFKGTKLPIPVYYTQKIDIADYATK